MKAFLNLPVADPPRSRRFFQALGFHELFSDQTVACIIIREKVYAMLVTFAKFREFTPKTVCDATSTEVFISLICESRPQVKDLVRKVAAAGGSAWDQPKDCGSIYRHGFQDPDGHRRELIIDELGRLADVLTYFHSAGDLADRPPIVTSSPIACVNGRQEGRRIGEAPARVANTPGQTNSDQKDSF